MIAKLTGIVDTIGDNSVILDVNGVGYLVSCSSRTLSQLGSRGAQVILYIETVMRAETLQLYGFANSEEQQCFRLLTTVQGVGMKMALALLSALSPSEIYHAISAKDATFLTRAEGVGPKLAGRIVSEPKDKIPDGACVSATIYSYPSSLLPMVEEAISALVNLGYRRIEAVTAVSKAQQHCGEKATLNDLIRQGLSLMARSRT